jgi:rubredoxin
VLKRAYNEFIAKFKSDRSRSAPLAPCEVCGYLTVGEQFDICSVCFWEYEELEPAQYGRATGGPNGALSVMDGRKNFQKYGVSKLTHIGYVHPPKPDQIPAGAVAGDEISERQQAAKIIFRNEQMKG